MDDLSRYSSSIGRAMFHMCFKVKYCKEIFDFWQIQQRCKEIFIEVAVAYKIKIIEIGFDSNHVHMIVDIGLLSVSQVAKLFKGTSTKLLFREFPWLKKEYFWNCGLWSPATFFDSVGRNIYEVSNYVNSQQYH